MKKIQKISMALLMSISTTLLFATGIASEQIGGSDISLSPSVGYDVATLRVSGDKADVTNSFVSGEKISIDLSSMRDGLYHYELSLENKQLEGETTQDSARQSGQFRIINGAASVYNETVAEKEAAVEAEANYLEQQALSSTSPSID